MRALALQDSVDMHGHSTGEEHVQVYAGAILERGCQSFAGTQVCPRPQNYFTNLVLQATASGSSSSRMPAPTTTHALDVTSFAQHAAEAHGQTESLEEAPSAKFVLRNIPARCTINDVLQLIHDSGFRGSFEYLLMPMKADGRRNQGHVFVSFLDPRQALLFQCVVDNASFGTRPSTKKVVMEVARADLFEKMLELSADVHVLRTEWGPVIVPPQCVYHL